MEVCKKPNEFSEEYIHLAIFNNMMGSVENLV